MKTLFLVRHAKSSWHDAAVPDRDRPLNDRGRHDVSKMAKRLAQRQVRVDLIMTSPALRARTTAAIMATALHYDHADIAVIEQLYGGIASDLLAVIQGINDQVGRAMLVGHNPELIELAHKFSDEIIRLPTCAVAELHFRMKHWLEVDKVKLEYLALDYPKILRGRPVLEDRNPI